MSKPMGFYFREFEDRIPPDPVPYSASRELAWQFAATVALILGGWYIAWRWTHSLNPAALWLSVPLATAETLAYFGFILWTINLWCVRDTPRREPARTLRDTLPPEARVRDRPVSVDVFITTLNEDPELVRLSIRDARRLEYPHPIDIRVCVLDDGARDSMQKIAADEGVGYLRREDNTGFKAGNLRHGMEQTSGDFIVICDADTRLFASFLENTLGYFRDPKVAWVQTPQWFYDLPEGQTLSQFLGRSLGVVGRLLGASIERLFGPIRVGQDPLGNEASMFYDVILRRRNWANAVFCCGAGSIHRREAVMWSALRSMSSRVDWTVDSIMSDVHHDEIYRDMSRYVRREIALETDLTPYRYHISEDIFTSIETHADAESRWVSVYHPGAESKMLSPQDLPAFLKQRFRYAVGTLDIAFHHNPLRRAGLSLPQRLMYSATIWSYVSCVWTLVFLVWPIIHLFTGISPVAGYSAEFYKHLVPFLFMHTLALALGTWGVPNWRNQSTYTALFAVNLRALWCVLRGKALAFVPTRKTVRSGRYLGLVLPQFSIIVLSVAGIAYACWQVWGGYRWDAGAVLANSFWALYNAAALSGIVLAASVRPPAGED